MVEQSEKRILYLRTDIGTQDLIGGGSVAHTLGVLKGFISLGAYVICASTAMQGILKNMFASFVPLAVPNFLQRVSFKLTCVCTNVLFYAKLKGIVRKHGINLIYQRYSMLNCVGVALAHRCTISLYLEYNGSESWVDMNWSPNRRIKINWLIDKIEMLNLKHATKIIVVSQVLKEQLLARGIEEHKIYVCPNGVDPDMFELRAIESLRKEKRAVLMLHDKFVFGFSGTFGPWHGVELLAYLIPKVVRYDKRIHFMFIGDGPLRLMLYNQLVQAQVLEQVTFVGMVPNEQVPAYLSACDAFLCPTQKNPDGSRFFGSPTKLFEYMIMAKPIVAFDIEQLGAVLRSDAPNLLVLPDDVEGFARVLLDVFHMPRDERDQIGNKLRKRAYERHTWQEHVRAFM